jgi:hypothetical protein
MQRVTVSTLPCELDLSRGWLHRPHTLFDLASTSRETEPEGWDEDDPLDDTPHPVPLDTALRRRARGGWRAA